MYDFIELEAAHDELWCGLRRHLSAAGVAQAPPHLTRGVHHEELWAHQSLLLAQACEYPLAKRYANRVRLVATPRYQAPGCAGATYRSVILVRNNDRAEALADLRGRRCVINERTSNSGMNLFRACIAPLAREAAFFESVQISGSHRRSVLMVARGDADVAAVDCVSYAHLQNIEPSCASQLKILSWSACTPSLPFITAAACSDRVLLGLRAALAALMRDRQLAAVRQQLMLEGFDLDPAGHFAEVLELERGATELGYPELM